MTFVYYSTIIPKIWVSLGHAGFLLSTVKKHGSTEVYLDDDRSGNSGLRVYCTQIKNARYN